MTDQRVALVTGGNRGLGYAICEALLAKGVTVALMARNVSVANTATQRLPSGAAPVKGFALDVTDTNSVRDGVRAVVDHFGRIDILVNNAGIYPENDAPADPAARRPGAGLSTDPAMVLDTIDCNSVGPYRVLQAALPVMRTQGFGRIVNVSSQMARLSDMHPGSPAYRMSKTALNALTTVVHAELSDMPNIKINSADPGWVRTDMGGPTADRDIAEGIDTIVWLATLPDDGPSGGFFRDRKPTDW